MNRKIVIDYKGLEIFEKVTSRFGNGAHILLSKKYENKKLKVILGKPVKIKNNKILIDFFGNEILERTANTFGTSSHIIIPKEYLGKKIKLIGEKNE